ncbi:MAG: type I restriction-modification system subunit M N-terminal domain-containing protein [Thermoguttaceae bacterium]|nr:type I restriction-modification system subunit M N-terminal domain-containing protein [Thermoguttaceae bacterium]
MGFENQLWRAVDALRSNMDAAEYKHAVLGLIFLKYISDAFEEQHAKLEAEKAKRADPEDPDEYRAVNCFWVPKEARWSRLKAGAKQPTIGKLVDEDIGTIAGTYHAWRGDKDCKKKYQDIPGFCKAATPDDIRHHGHILTPGRYVGAAEVEDDGEPFDEKMQRLTNTLAAQFKPSAKLEKAIVKNLASLGFSPKEPA